MSCSGNSQKKANVHLTLCCTPMVPSYSVHSTYIGSYSYSHREKWLTVQVSFSKLHNISYVA